MKELITALGFKHLPTLNEFRKKAFKSQTIAMDDRWIVIYQYGDFIDQPLNLSQFIHCKLVEGVWQPLEKPKDYEYWIDNLLKNISPEEMEAFKEFQKAEEQVIFKIEESERRKSTKIEITLVLYFDIFLSKYPTVEKVINDGIKLELK
jgi:hypothetical protein